MRRGVSTYTSNLYATMITVALTLELYTLQELIRAMYFHANEQLEESFEAVKTIFTFSGN